MINHINLDDGCVGCSACEQICNYDAIKLVPDRDGFLYPSVDESLCKACSACSNVCVLRSNDEGDVSIKDAYYGWNNDDEVRYNSSSGGFFSAVAQIILDRGGVVFGAIINGYDYIYSDSKQVDLSKIRKSKYTEIHPMKSFKLVKEHLITGIPVLFCGSPCRVAGLKQYLNKDYPNLITVDFLCGGVASPLFLSENMRRIEKKYKSVIKNVDFRTKKYGWGGQYVAEYCFENGKKKYIPAREDPYYTGFLLKIINRKSCYDCRYVSNHKSDITMGDFWDYKSIEGLKNDGKGISMWVVNSQRGKTIIEDCAKTMTMFQIDYDLVSGNFTRSNNYRSMRPVRDSFFEKANEIGFIKASKEYMKLSDIILYRIKHIIKSSF